MQKLISESELRNIISESVRKILSENNFGSQLDKIRARYYIEAKRKGLSGEEAKKYVDAQMSDFMAKQTALTDFSKELHREHPLTGNYDEDEFYTHSRDLADT